MENNTFIDPASVRYLVFEGGGGKGFAYLGALQAFKHPDVGILKEHYPGAGYQIDPARIDGVAGASAGAIFAALLGCGATYKMLEDMIRDNRIINAFEKDTKDELKKFRIPYPQSYQGFRQAPKNQIIGTLAELNDTVSPFMAKLFKRDDGLAAIISSVFDKLHKFGPYIGKISGLSDYYGLDSGFGLRQLLNELFANGITTYINAKKDDPNFDRNFKLNMADGGVVTFRDHYQVMKFPLCIASFNVQKNQLVYFNYKTAPDMAIADAVRSSLSIPFAFMPVNILKDSQEPTNAANLSSRFSKEESEKYAGIWIDGGVRANLPVEAFDSFDEKAKEKMLLLRFRSDSYTSYNHFGSYFYNQIMMLISSTSKLYIKKHNLKDRVIELFVGNLSTMEFKAAWKDVEKLAYLNAAYILKIFRL